MCFFSIVTTVYNAQKYILRAMDSVRMQTEVDYEYIVVDNGSTDGSLSVIQTFIEDNPEMKIRLIHLDENCGISGGRNTGIKSAKGQYICFLDADDYWANNKLSVVRQNIKQNTKYNVFCHWEKHIKGDEQKIVKYRSLNFADPFTDLLENGNCLSPSAMTIERNILVEINGFDEKLISGEEDLDCWLRLARQGAKFYMIQDPLGYWIIRNDSLSAKHIAHTEAVVKMLQIHFDYYETINNHKKAEKMRKKNKALNYCGCGRVVSLNGNRKDGNLMYKKAIMNDPLYYKPYAGIFLNFFHL